MSVRTSNIHRIQFSLTKFREACRCDTENFVVGVKKILIQEMLYIYEETNLARLQKETRKLL